MRLPSLAPEASASASSATAAWNVRQLSGDYRPVPGSVKRRLTKRSVARHHPRQAFEAAGGLRDAVGAEHDGQAPLPDRLGVPESHTQRELQQLVLMRHGRRPSTDTSYSIGRTRGELEGRNV